MTGEALASTSPGDTKGGMDKPHPKPRPAPRRQAQRSADTRTKLINATISCIHRLGYGSTTVTVVAEEAGVSRGAMTHQFPTKTDLVLAVVLAVYKSDSEHYSRALNALSPIEGMRAMPAIMWEVISRPSAIAVMEIMLASRSDPELADRLRRMQSEIDVHAHAAVVARHAAAGIVERPDGEAIHRVFVAAARGLALEAVFMNNAAEVEKSIAVLSELLVSIYPNLAE
ncbi:MAG: TetR/AcrR family transcriptional regulator [Sphingomonas sp.]